MRRKVYALAAVLFTVSWLLSACSLSGNTAQGGPNEPQVLNLVVDSEPPNLDSATLIDGTSITVLNNVMEGLMRLDKDNKPVPAMAVDFPEISPDKKTYTFKIRDAKWSDGEPVKAQDFEYAWKRALDPKTKSEYAYILYPIKNAEEYNQGKVSENKVGVKALDDSTLQVKLKEPIPYFLSLTAFATYFPQREDIIEKYGKQYAKDPDKMVYNGPFVLSRWEHDQGLQYRKNDEYWDKNNVYLTEVNVKIVPDSTQAMSLYTSGQVDVAPLDDNLVEVFKNNKEYLPVTRGSTYYIIFNTDDAFLANKNIRKAISLAIDRDDLVKDVLKNGSEPAGGVVPPSIMGYNNQSFRDQAPAQPDYDPALAKQYFEKGLQELGLSAPPSDLTLMVYDDDRKKVAVAIQEQLETNLGLKVAIDPKPFKQKLNLEKKGYFEMSVGRWVGDYNDPMTFLDVWKSDSPVNFGDWKNPNFDRLIDTSKQTTNYQERNENLIKAEKMLIDDAALAPLYYESKSFVQKTYVHNLVRHPIGPEYSLKWAYIKGKAKQ
jgi:oligopeptide transport system substrate-binding protein